MDLFSRLRKMKILLVDDDKWIRDSLSLFFEGEECHLLAYETAEEALEALKDQVCDIIIADYRLPGIDGLEFFRRIQDSHPHGMKIIITAYKDDQVVSEAAEIGIQDFITKPFSTKTIEQALSWLMNKHENDGKSRL